MALRTLNEFCIATAQVNPRLGDVEANLAMYEERVRAARGLGADLIVFPELSLTGYALRIAPSLVEESAAGLMALTELPIAVGAGAPVAVPGGVAIGLCGLPGAETSRGPGRSRYIR